MPRLSEHERSGAIGMLRDGVHVSDVAIYTETIKLCPLDVYVCQFLMYERISFNFLHYTRISFRNVMHLNEIHLITSGVADNSKNTSTLKIKSHNINSLCVHNSEQFKHIKTSLSKLSSKMLSRLAVCIAFTTTTINLQHTLTPQNIGQERR